MQITFGRATKQSELATIQQTAEKEFNFQRVIPSEKTRVVSFPIDEVEFTKDAIALKEGTPAGPEKTTHDMFTIIESENPTDAKKIARALKLEQFFVKLGFPRKLSRRSPQGKALLNEGDISVQKEYARIDKTRFLVHNQVTRQPENA